MVSLDAQLAESVGEPLGVGQGMPAAVWRDRRREITVQIGEASGRDMLLEVCLPAGFGRRKIEAAIEDGDRRSVGRPAADQRLERGGVDRGPEVHDSSLTRC